MGGSHYRRHPGPRDPGPADTDNRGLTGQGSERARIDGRTEFCRVKGTSEHETSILRNTESYIE